MNTPATSQLYVMSGTKVVHVSTITDEELTSLIKHIPLDSPVWRMLAEEILRREKLQSN